MTNVRCLLCGRRPAGPFHSDRRRDYLRCEECALVFVPPHQRLGPEREKREYDLHQNDVDDPGYRRFLSRLMAPMERRLPRGARGLDFGCGPAPALAAMFEAAGFPMALYDPFYADDPLVLTRRYDFITLTEVAEHLFEPGVVFDRLFSILEPGGWLGVMTKCVIDRDAFARWHYKNDPTHVCFFSRATFQWLGDRHGASVEFVGSDVALFRKTGSMTLTST